MNGTMTALLVLICAVGGAQLGMWLRSALPEHHLDDQAKDIVKLALALVSTMTALVLGLVISSARGTFEAEDAMIKNSAATLLALDRVLARYGAETADIRESLRRAAIARLAMTWPEEGSGNEAMLESTLSTLTAEQIMDRIQALAPATEGQRLLQNQALQLGGEFLKSRWLVFIKAESTIQQPFLVILVFWLTLIFIGFGLFAPPNATILVALALCALSISTAVFLFLEMDGPFDGLIKVSSQPLRYAISHLGQ